MEVFKLLKLFFFYCDSGMNNCMNFCVNQKYVKINSLLLFFFLFDGLTEIKQVIQNYQHASQWETKLFIKKN